MVYERGEVFYVKRTFRGVGRVEKSLRTTNKRRAKRLEDMLLSLHARGRLDLLRAFDAGQVTIEEVAEAYEAGRIPQLTRRLRRPDVPLGEAVRQVRRTKRGDVKPSTLERYETGWGHFERIAGEETPVEEALTAPQIREFKAVRREEGVARETVNNDLVAVSILCTYAVEQGWIPSRPKIEKYETKVRVNYLTPGQLRLYMAHLSEPTRTMMQLLVATGMRLGEVEGLTPSQVRWEEGGGARLLLEDAKSSEGVRAVFVPEWAADALRRWMERRGAEGKQAIFRTGRRTVQRHHNEACEAAGIHGYTIHDHRHTAAVTLARAGMPLNLLQQQLGHATIQQTMRYARFHPDYGDVETHFQKASEALGLAASGDTAGDTPQQDTRESAREEENREHANGD